MAYVAVKGGERAIDNAHAWLAEEATRRPRDAGTVAGADRGSTWSARWIAQWAKVLYTTGNLPPLAVKQAQGDLIEAHSLPCCRAYRTTLPPLRAFAAGGYRRDAERSGASPAIFKDLPGGQVLGPTYDYTHRLLDFELAARKVCERAGAAGQARRRQRCRACPTSWATRG